MEGRTTYARLTFPQTLKTVKISSFPSTHHYALESDKLYGITQQTQQNNLFSLFTYYYRKNISPHNENNCEWTVVYTYCVHVMLTILIAVICLYLYSSLFQVSIFKYHVIYTMLCYCFYSHLPHPQAINKNVVFLGTIVYLTYGNDCGFLLLLLFLVISIQLEYMIKSS